MAIQLFELPFFNVPPLKQDLSRVGVLPEHREKRGGLSGAAWAKNSGHTARREIRIRILHQKGSIVHRSAPLAPDGQPLADADSPELQQRFALCRAGHSPFRPGTRVKQAKPLKIRAVLRQVFAVDVPGAHSAALFQQDDLIRSLQPEVCPMVDGQNGPAGGFHSEQHLQQLDRRLVVQICKAFVQQDAAALHDIEAGEGRFLFFAAGQGRKGLIQQRRDAKLCGGLFDSFIHLPGRDTDVFQTEAHLLPQGIHAELQVGILEQHRQVGGALLGVQRL